MHPPAVWFENPKLSRPTPLTVEASGRVYGHLAAWNTKHIGIPGSVKPPKSRSNYAYYRTGVLHSVEGKQIPVGQITLAGGHAPMTADASEATRHYDETQSAKADVAAGEDQHGIWLAGSMRPGTTEEELRAFRASPPSGDWRTINGSLELVAACLVNVGGFPLARAMVASGGQPLALVAAGAQAMLLTKLRNSDPDLIGRIEAIETALGIEKG